MVLLTAVLGACGSTKVATIEPVSRDIGPPPSDLQEVQVKAPSVGENALLIAQRERIARKVANYAICELRAEWMRTRIEFLAGKGDAAPPAECEPPDGKVAEQVAKASKLRWKKKPK